MNVTEEACLVVTHKNRTIHLVQAWLSELHLFCLLAFGHARNRIRGLTLSKPCIQ